MYIHVYIHICIYTYTYIYINIHRHIDRRMYICKYLQRRTYIHAHADKDKDTDTDTDTHTHNRHAHTNIYLHVDTSYPINAYTCTRVYLNLFKNHRRLMRATGRQQKYHHRTSSELENSVLGINHVTNVTTVLSETKAADRVSRYHRRLMRATRKS